MNSLNRIITSDGFEVIKDVLLPENLLTVARCFERGHDVIVDDMGSVHCTQSSRSFFKSFTLGKSDQRLANILFEAVRQKQGQTILDNSTDRTLEVAKRFLKLSGNEQFIDLNRELTAARLGISSNVFDANPGFQEFAKKTHLHRFLLKFGHPLQIDPLTRKISLQVQNNMTPWEDISPKIRYEEGVWTGHYSRHGIEEKSRFDWTVLEPNLTDDPSKWGNQYALKIIVWNREDPSLTGELKPVFDGPSMVGIHTYFHLLSPDQKDNVTSMGLYRPNKHGPMDHAFPLRMRKAKIQSPEETDAWGGRFFSLTVAASKEEYLSIKQMVEQDHASGQLVYNIANQNCNEYALKALKKVGIHIPCFIPVSNLLPATMINILGVALLGSTRVDKDVGETTSYISSFSDIFDESKAKISSSYPLEKAFKKIEEWRYTKIASLEKELVANPSRADAISLEIEKTRFAVPDEYRL